MRGSLRKHYKDSWSLILDLGYQVDPETGRRKRRQKWITVRGTKRDAERRLAELLHQRHTHTFIDPSAVTFGTWIEEWLDKAIKPPRRTLRAYETYKSAIARHIQPALGAIQLQELSTLDIEQYHARALPGPGHRREASRHHQ